MKKILFKYIMSKQWFINMLKDRFYGQIEKDVVYNPHTEGCGLEDQNIENKYNAMKHGFQRGVEDICRAFENSLINN